MQLLPVHFQLVEAQYHAIQAKPTVSVAVDQRMLAVIIFILQPAYVLDAVVP